LAEKLAAGCAAEHVDAGAQAEAESVDFVPMPPLPAPTQAQAEFWTGGEDRAAILVRDRLRLKLEELAAQLDRLSRPSARELFVEHPVRDLGDALAEVRRAIARVLRERRREARGCVAVRRARGHASRPRRRAHRRAAASRAGPDDGPDEPAPAAAAHSGRRP
jgi:hypothetical protein